MKKITVEEFWRGYGEDWVTLRDWYEWPGHEIADVFAKLHWPEYIYPN